MHKIFYNPKTRKPARIFLGPTVIPEGNPWYKYRIKNAFADSESARKAAIENDCMGSVFYLENGNLYELYMIPLWAWEPVFEREIEIGINWATAYFLSRGDAQLFYDNILGQRDRVSYDETGDVYSVHYHM